MKQSVCAAAMLAIATCAAGSAQAAVDPASCLEPVRFDSWKALNNRAVIITDKSRHNFKVSLEIGCYDVDFARAIGVRSFSTSRLSCVVPGDYVLIPRMAGTDRQRCRIEKVEAYTPDMAKADALAKAAKISR